MSWPRRIQGHREPLSLEGLRRRLGACPQCGATPQLRLEPAKLIRRRRRRTLDEDGRSRELRVACTSESCRGVYRIAASGAIRPAEQTAYPNGTRLSLGAFANGSDDPASGAALSYELAADPWAGSSFEEAILALKNRLEQHPP